MAKSRKRSEAETLIVGIASRSIPGALSPKARAALEQVKSWGDLTGKANECLVLYPPTKHGLRLIAVGLGEATTLTLERVRRATALAVRQAQALKLRAATLEVDSFLGNGLSEEAVVEALMLAGHLAQFRSLELKVLTRKETAGPSVRLSLSRNLAPAAARRGSVLAEAANYVRALANRPANLLAPQDLAQEARRLARSHSKLSVRVLELPELKRSGFGALVGVGSGSSHPPVLIELKYRGGRPGQTPIALVGKGITFDSGGLSLKPANKMDEMKMDMSGAAAVLGILRAASSLRLPINLTGVIPAAENLPSGTAYRPGDVLTSLSGRTIEVLNTDAEGRLVLADALTFAARQKPACIVDLATLTGAVIVALGHAATGLVSNRPELAAQLKAAGETSGERVWELPLWDDHRELLKSEVADIANISSTPGAGTIVGAAFLEPFVANIPWAHLDIAGTVSGEHQPFYGKGATGVGVRLVIAWLRERLQKAGV